MTTTRWRRVRARSRHHPELGALLLVVAAWVLVLWVGHGSTGGHHVGGPPGHAHHLAPASDGSGAGVGGTSFAAALGMWTVMAMAMMGPAALPPARHVGRNSLRRRRQRAIATFLVPYVGLWVAFGVIALAVVRLVGEPATSSAAVVGAVAVAVGWQLLPYRRRARRDGHRTVPLPASGRRATVACARFGLRFGSRCVVTCWPLMALMAVVGHRGLGWMVVLTAIVAAEAYQPWLHPTVKVWGRQVGARLGLVPPPSLGTAPPPASA